MRNSEHIGGATCPLCGRASKDAWCQATDREYFTTTDCFTYYRCAACDVLFINPVPSAQLEVIYPPNYYSFRGSSNSPIIRLKNLLSRHKFRRLLKQLPGKTLNVLDVGGGSGFELDLLRRIDQRIRRTQIVDLDPSAGEVARSNGHGYFQGRIEDFTSAQTFDLILAMNLIEHVAQPQAVLRKIASLLSPGGFAFVQTPNYDSLDQRIFRHRNWAGYHCPRHWVLFTRHSLSHAAENAGLRVQSTAYMQGAAFWAGSILIEGGNRGLLSVGPDRLLLEHPLFLPLAAMFTLIDWARSPFSKTSQMFSVLRRAVDPTARNLTSDQRDIS